MSATKRCVLWAAIANGYRVVVYEDGQELHRYSAGNNERDSQSYVPLDSLHAVPLDKLRAMAKLTAGYIAKEYHVPANMIDEDSDMEADLKEELGA